MLRKNLNTLQKKLKPLQDMLLVHPDDETAVGLINLYTTAYYHKEKLEEIKDNVLNGIGDAVKVFTAIKVGFDLVIKTITGVTGRIAGFVTRLALAPVKALTNVLRGAPLLQNIFPGQKNLAVPVVGGD